MSEQCKQLHVCFIAGAAVPENAPPTGDLSDLLLRVGQRMMSNPEGTFAPSPRNQRHPDDNYDDDGDDQDNYEDATQNTPSPEGSVHNALDVADMSLESSQESRLTTTAVGVQDESQREVSRTQRFKVESVRKFSLILMYVHAPAMKSFNGNICEWSKYNIFSCLRCQEKEA